jgi:geranyl-CoA carboxylase alpha subunit
MKATPFDKVLIANRGEIALRVIRSARWLGFKTVAVYSTADAGARHVMEADQAVCIGEPLPSQSYLRIDAIIAAAQATGADAVHPGYGFLAENENFAHACREAGLVFIGPSPEAIEAMGNKAGAKQRMTEAGVPCVPGYQDDQDEERLAREARRLGYPVMIKAVAGGGGRGMRLVADGEDFRAALHSAKSEAQSAFGDGDVLLERAVVNSRHVEIQIFADRCGNAIHLGERDCSVQRRHQKVVEEAPSPAVTPALRAEMGAAAVKAALAIGYEGAGTLEFLLDERGQWYFLEMNTRLQVEHPVTEAITGIDLVEWQLRVAAGEPLPLKQDQVRFEGHAIEARLCAEDPERNFIPQSGRMGLWLMPDGVRVEHALESGMEVTPYYDSMIAKLIAHGRTRDDARRRLAAALDEGVALGVTTNRSFLARCLRHPVFASGDATTGFIAAHALELLARTPEENDRALAVGGLLLRATANGGAAAAALAPSLAVGLRIESGGRMNDVSLQREVTGRFLATLGERTFALALPDIGPNKARVECDGVVESVPWLREGAALQIQFRGQTYSIEDRTLAAVVASSGARDGRIRASINGRLIAVHAAVGDSLAAGQPVFTLEAMKMEHTHTAPVAGKLRTFSASLNDQVSAAHVIAEIEPLPGIP